MKPVRKMEDSAVSPIIATILLVGITVTMIATAYALLQNDIPNPVPQTPSAAIKVVYDAQLTGTSYTGNYSVFINSLNGNVSVDTVNLVITLSNTSVIELGLGTVYESSGYYNYSSYLTTSMQSSGGYLTSTSMISLYLHNSVSHITRIALVDTATNGEIGASLLP